MPEPGAAGGRAPGVRSLASDAAELVARVRRGLSARVRLRLARVASPQRRQDRALAALREVERLEPSLVSSTAPRTMLARDRVIRAPGMPDSVRNMVPVPFRAWEDDDPQLRRVRTRVNAALVVMAKFDLGASVKLRAAYLDPRVTVAIQPVRPSGQCGVTRAVQAHQIVEAHAPGLVPPLLGHGELGGDLRYLVEGWLEGRPLMSATRLATAMPRLLEAIHTVQEGHGYELVRPSQRWGEELPERWARTRESGIVPAEVGQAVEELLERDLTMRTSWVHGDLVASNVMQTPKGLVLIDLEHSMIAPVMHDAAKLHLFAATPAQTLRLVLDVLGQDIPEGGYTAREELALVHAHMLSRYPNRSKSLEGHPRAEVYEEQALRQVRRIADVLGG